ncbi:hypothetical protein [Pelotalea chapellei]|uniref:Uncharacterized protein n=1 Tax=Pelotalea chapellei TaxID=44671 RepID=A0ABS5U6H6_9BACT|nr:hypothetical protein [Pelotalea chapellei]MBT1071262.1 hypothetical protein [Pelotalea chapellei]
MSSSGRYQSLEMVDQQHQALYDRFLSTSDPKEKPFLLRRLANLCQVKKFLLSNVNSATE